MKKQRWRSRFSTALVFCFASAAVLAGCSSGEDDTEPESGGNQNAQSVNVAVLPTSNMAAIYIGQQEGFFRDEGIELNLTTVGGGAEMIAGMQAGSFDFVVAGYVPLFAASASGLPVAIVSANDVGGASAEEEWQTLLVGANSPIKNTDDLEGATIGVNALQGVAEATIRASLREQGVDDTTLEFVEIPFSEVPAALANQTVDAAFGSEPFITSTLADGGKIIDTPSYNLGKNFPNGAWATSRELIDTDPELVEAFQRAIEESIDYSTENPDAVRAILPTYTALTPELAEEIRLPVFRSKLDRPQMETLAGILEEFGVIETVPDMDELIHE